MRRAGPTARVDGHFHSVHGAKRGPAPAHDVGIWIGALRPRLLRQWAEELAETASTHGTSAFVLIAGDDADTISTFAHEVAPAARELIAAERRSSPGGAEQPAP